MQPTGESSKKSGPRMYFYFWRRRRTGLVAMRTQWLKPKYIYFAPKSIQVNSAHQLNGFYRLRI
jgi:hypothetical protein